MICGGWERKGEASMKILHVTKEMTQTSGVATFVREIAERVDGSTVTVTPCSVFGYDIVHIHGIWTPWFHGIVRAARKGQIPIVWSPHGMLAPWAMAHKRWKKWPVWHLWQKRDLLRAKVIHATSDLEVEWIRRLGFTQNVVTVPLGTHLPPIKAREALSPGDSHVLLFVGRIYPIKGLVNLLQAWGMLKSSGNSQVHKWMIRLVGPDQAGHVEELKKLAERLGISDSVIFTGPLFGEELAKEYRQADCFVLPSFTENFGGVVVDALSYGVPVIASTATPWSILQQEPQSGWWVSNEPRKLADCLARIMEMTREERCQLGMNGRTRVEERYTWTTVAQKMSEVYDELLRMG